MTTIDDVVSVMAAALPKVEPHIVVLLHQPPGWKGSLFVGPFDSAKEADAWANELVETGEAWYSAPLATPNSEDDE